MARPKALPRLRVGPHPYDGTAGSGDDCRECQLPERNTHAHVAAGEPVVAADVVDPTQPRHGAAS